jgi:hypothetical protein
VFFYGCTSFWKRGVSVCANNLVARMDVLDAEVLATLQDDVCRPAVVEEAVRLALEELAPARQDRNRERLEALHGGERLPQVSLSALERRLRAKLADWRGLLRRNVPGPPHVADRTASVHAHDRRGAPRLCL